MGQKVLKETSSGKGKSRVTDCFYQVFRVAPQKKSKIPRTALTHTTKILVWGVCMREVFYGSESHEGDLFRERKEHRNRLPLPGVSSSPAKKISKIPRTALTHTT